MVVEHESMLSCSLESLFRSFSVTELLLSTFLFSFEPTFCAAADFVKRRPAPTDVVAMLSHFSVVESHRSRH